MHKTTNITIIGTGLLGASLGLALKENGHKGEIYGVGRTQSTLNKALSIGAIDVVAGSLKEAVKNSEIAVLATPLGTFANIFAQIAQCENDDLIITDVGSTKQKPLEWAKKHLKNPGKYIPAHPMAGSEKSGPEAASANLFAGKPCIITPTDTSDEDALKVVAKLWYSLGMNIIRLSASEHDRKVAAISHLPHLTAGLLLEAGRKNGALDITSTGFADATRVADGDPKMWTDILLCNKNNIIAALKEFTDDANGLAKILEKCDDKNSSEQAHKIQQWLIRHKKGFELYED